MLEKVLIVNSLLGDIPPDTKQAAETEGIIQASLYMYPSQNLNNLERALKKFKLHMGYQYDLACVQVTRVLVFIV